MRLVFKKDHENQITVFNEVNGESRAFSYIEMIKELMKSKKLDDPDISDGFVDAEIKSIKTMISLINKEVAEVEEADATPTS
jgi:hypothetical protein